MSKWFSTSYQEATAGGKIDRAHGIIESVSVNTEGEALGHGVFLDESFINSVIEKGNEKTQGIKARFGHPNMCSTALGTFIGRFKNFRKEAVTRDNGSKAWRAVADLFVSNAARETPNGDLYNYLFDMADAESDMFGTSIVFEPGESYLKSFDGRRVFRDSATGSWIDSDGETIKDDDVDFDKPFATLIDLHGCDVVDSPAANDGLFSQFANETIAGQITEFFNLHPQALEMLTSKPEVLDAIAKHGAKIEEFITRYQAHKQTGDKEMTKEKAENSEQEEQLSPPIVVDDKGVEIEQTPAPVTPDAEDAPEVKEEISTEDVAESATEETPAESEEVEEQEAETPEVVAADVPRSEVVSEFSRMVESFGVEVAARVFAKGGSYEDAKDEALTALTKEVEDLRAQLAKKPGGKAAQVSHEGREKTPLFKVK